MRHLNTCQATLEGAHRELLVYGLYIYDVYLRHYLWDISRSCTIYDSCILGFDSERFSFLIVGKGAIIFYWEGAVCLLGGPKFLGLSEGVPIFFQRANKIFGVGPINFEGQNVFPRRGANFLYVLRTHHYL